MSLHSSRWRGLEAEAHFIWACMRNKWNICRPYSPQLKYDFAINKHKDNWSKVQVKSSYIGRYNSSTIAIKTCSKNNTSYTSCSVDYFYCYNPEIQRAWLIPYSSTSGVTTIQINYIKPTCRYHKYEVKI